MTGDLVECWLCEAVIAAEAARARYRDAQGRLHLWPDAHGRWRAEYLCSECALVYRDALDYTWSGTQRVDDRQGLC